MSDDDLFGTRPRGAPAMGRRGGGERSTERASPALAADFADDASDEETARPPARRSGGWADEDAAGGIARDFDDASPLRAPRDGGVDGTPGGPASRRRMDSASKHDALAARGGPGPDIPEIPTLSDARPFADDAYADDAADAPEYTAGTNTNVRSIHELNRATFAGGAAEARFDDDDDDDGGGGGAPRGGAVDVSLLASALVPRACLEEEGEEEWVPARLWNAVKHDLRREREEAERDAHEAEARLGEGALERGGFGFSGDVFEEDAVGGGTLGAADFASPAKTGAAAEAKKRKGLLGRMRKKLGKMAGVR